MNPRKYSFAICGKQPVLAALSSGRNYLYQRLCIAYGRERDEEVTTLLRLANRKSIRLEKMEAKEMDKFVPGHFNHQGLALLLKAPPEATPLEDLIEMSAKTKRYSVLALDGLSDHQNIGAITRTAAAFGFSAIIGLQDRAAPLIHPTVWRLSQGAAEHLHFTPVVNLVQTLEELKENGFWIAGAMAGNQGQDIRSVKDWPEKICLVLGSEGKGLRRLTTEHLDMKVSIPFASKAAEESLNVSQAAGIFLWEIFKNS